MMGKFFLVSAAALTLAGAPQMVSAQNTATAPTTLSATQRSTYQTWPSDQRSTYDRWPADYQSYYWTLDPNQQQGWWRLTDEQRAMVFGMTPEQRTSAWQSIQSQMSGGQAMAGGGAVQQTYIPGNMTAPPASEMNKSYPVCTRKGQDGCQNPGEGGAPGRSRAIDYWPGAPRSETRH
jgi:hypothetical protein